MNKMPNLLQQLRNALSNQKNAQNMVNLFTSAPNQHLSYKKYYDFIQLNLGIKVAPVELR